RDPRRQRTGALQKLRPPRQRFGVRPSSAALDVGHRAKEKRQRTGALQKGDTRPVLLDGPWPRPVRPGPARWPGAPVRRLAEAGLPAAARGNGTRLRRIAETTCALAYSSLPPR